MSQNNLKLNKQENCLRREKTQGTKESTYYVTLLQTKWAPDVLAVKASVRNIGGSHGLKQCSLVLSSDKVTTGFGFVSYCVRGWGDHKLLLFRDLSKMWRHIKLLIGLIYWTFYLAPAAWRISTKLSGLMRARHILWKSKSIWDSTCWKNRAK